MLNKILLILMLLPLSIVIQGQDNNSMLVVRFADENISIDNATERFIDNKDISKDAFVSKIKQAQLKVIEDVASRENYTIKGMNEQVLLIPSEFADLHKKQSIDKVSEDIDKPFLQKLLGIFSPSNPDSYMSARFSSDKKDRISTTMQQQETEYALFLHKYEIERSLCGKAQMKTHYSVLNDEGEVLLAGQNIYRTDMKNSMNKNILGHILESGFDDAFGIIFDKLK